MAELTSSHSVLRDDNVNLRRRVEELEQYTRRPNVRLFGIPTVLNETSTDVENFVKNMLVHYGTDISPASIDRAHRVGKRKKNRSGIEVQAIIVRFTTFRDRTKFYKLRKQLKEKGATFSSICLDLTYERLGLLNQARDIIADVESIKFAYTDINCNLRVFTVGGDHKLFKSIEGLQSIITGLA